jgi:hypothetical protein
LPLKHSLSLPNDSFPGWTQTLSAAANSLQGSFNFQAYLKFWIVSCCHKKWESICAAYIGQKSRRSPTNQFAGIAQRHAD